MPKCKYFYGGISLLNSLNCVNSINILVAKDIDILYLFLKLIDEPIDFKIKLKDYLDKGLPFQSKGTSALFYYITENKLYDMKKIY
ncbi:MAG: hypothetical protein ACLSS0_04445 [Clostridioides difficile]